MMSKIRGSLQRKVEEQLTVLGKDLDEKIMNSGLSAKNHFKSEYSYISKDKAKMHERFKIRVYECSTRLKIVKNFRINKVKVNKLSAVAKICTKSKMDKNEVNRLKQKYNLLKGRNHPSLIHVYDVYEDNIHFIYVKEKFNSESLASYIKRTKHIYDENNIRTKITPVFAAIA